MAAYRLLVVSHATDIGGAERGIIRKLGHIDRGLFEPSFACPFEGPMSQAIEELGIRVYSGHPSKRLLNIRRDSLGEKRFSALLYPLDLLVSSIRLAHLIRRGGFDVVLTDSAKAHIYGTLAGFLAGRPVAWHIHDIHEAPVFSRLNLWLLKIFAVRFTRRIVSVSEAARMALVKLGVPETKIKTVYNGLDMEEVLATRKPDEVRAEFGIDPEAPVAGFVGRLVDWKGPDYFIRAAARVAGEMPEARFLVVGDAVFGERSYADGLKDLSRDLGLNEKVLFTGFRDDVQDIMGALDVMVHASVLPEPFGQVLLEAMAQGCPVIATAGGGVSEIVDEGIDGLLVPPRDVDAMARAIAALLGDREKRRKMGEAAFKKVSRSFTVDRMSRGIEEQLLKAIRGR